MKERSRFLLWACLVLQMTSLGLSSGQNMTPADIMEKYGKAVVLIAGIKNGQEIGLGSGFIVKSDGVIVTNHHVMQGAYPALVKTKSGDIYEDISIIDSNERQDIAVIKIKAFDLPTVRLGNSNNVRVGEKVIVIGNPHGLENTISDGLLSQIRDSGKGYSLHQISAPISAGSSGSPVFNERGEVIGIATLSDILGQNLNFSVPINYARGMVDGPIKYSLKEFAGLPNEPTLLSESKKADTSENAAILEKLNKFVISLLAAREETLIGCLTTAEPHEKKFDARKYRIDPGIYSANQSFKVLLRDLNTLSCPDKTLQSLKDALLTATTLSIESSNTLLQAFERTTVFQNVSNYPYPDWTRSMSAMREITNVITNKIDKEFIASFMEKMRKEDPKLESYVVPYFYTVYENKDKSQEEIAAENSRLGHLKVEFSWVSRIPIVITIQKNGPADLSRIKRGDIFLGVEGGPDFKTDMDYRAFQKTTKPGETYAFRISRSGKTILAYVKLD